jgi:hypothetical protein
MCNVLHDGMHRPRKVDLVLIVHRDANKELCLPGSASDVLAQFVAFRDKVIWIAGHGRVSHMREFDFVSAWQETVENRRNLTLENELSIDQFDLLLGHLCLSSSSSLLLSIWCWTIMFVVLVRFLILIVCECLC